jgi:AraC-like DNA-binding protein
MERGSHGAAGADAGGDASRVDFATRDLPSHDRDACIREFYGRISMGVDVEPLHGVPLEMDVTTLFLPRVKTLVATTSPLKWERRPDLTADGVDDVCITWSAGGYTFCRPGLSDVEIAPGTACLIPLDRPMSTSSFDNSWKINVQIERRLLADRVPGLEDLPPDRINRRSPEGSLLFDYQLSLARLPISRAMAPKVAEHLVDLAALALGPSTELRHAVQRGGVRAAQLVRLKRYVAANLQRSTLCSRNAAQALGISERYVRSLMAADQTSFSDYVADLRLDSIRHTLALPSEAARPVADIAAEFGFDEPSTFYRRFKARFGASPSELRRPAPLP